MRYSRRRVWLGLLVAGLLVVAGVQAFDLSTVEVAVYNDTAHSFAGVALDVGAGHEEAGSLAPRESLARRFGRDGGAMDLKLSIDAEPPLWWRAPGLVQKETSRVTLRVDGDGRVTVSTETGLLWRVWGWLD